MLRHLFREEDAVFCHNEAVEYLHKDPISVKNILQGDAAWSMSKVVLEWELDTKKHHLKITPKKEENMITTLDTIPGGACQVSLHKWIHMLGILRRITPAMYRVCGMFKCLKHALQQARGQRATLLSEVHEELHAWHRLVSDMVAITTQMQ